MSIVGHGIDLIEIARIEQVLARHEDRFMRRVLTAAERARAVEYHNPTPFIAGRWAAKEALLKLIGTGWRGKIAWSDMEILPNALGEPQVVLSGETARLAEKRRVHRVFLSISHTRTHAIASAIGVARVTGDGHNKSAAAP